MINFFRFSKPPFPDSEIQGASRPLIFAPMRKTLCALLFSILTHCGFAQHPIDSNTTHIKYLPEITRVGSMSRSDLQQLPEIVGTSIYAGKKSSLLVLKNVAGNLATNTMRQVMAKIPGLHIWESDGSGIQIGIATRGLSPNRSWEFNVRQNGYDIAADPYGYPEAYYNPQLQAVQRIEFIRGHGALQYGPQFGGMINYILRDGSEFKKPLQFETQQTLGSFGLYNHFSALGGRRGKWNYYTFFDRRQASGYRANSRYFTQAGFASLSYKANAKLTTTLEYMRSHSRSQQPGGLTDSALYANNQQSLRSRNWMDIDWTTLALRIQYAISETSRLEAKVFTLLGDRNSVGFLPSNGLLHPDTVVQSTGQYAPRNVNTDNYRNTGAEIKWIGDYSIGKTNATLSAGVRWFQGNTNRLAADEKGTTGIAYDLQRTNNSWIRNLDFQSRNGALFAENIFRIGTKWLLIPGVRYEWISGKVNGQNSIQNGTAQFLIPKTKQRGFLLAGIGIEYHLKPRIELYANITEAYRPVQFADLSTPPGSDRIDPNLQDARGFNADLGFRGQMHKRIYADISLFYLHYGNRIGTLLQQDAVGNFYTLRTNIGSSRAYGVEWFTEYQGPLLANQTQWKWGGFISYAFNNAQYELGQKKDLHNNRVENAPQHTLRSGLNLQYRNIKLGTQFSHVSGVYSDANNTRTPSANGQNGWIPGYEVVDLTLSFPVKKWGSVKTGINNLTDAVYFTRRAGGYPGPGALPADGRTAFLTVTYQL